MPKESDVNTIINLLTEIGKTPKAFCSYESLPFASFLNGFIVGSSGTLQINKIYNSIYKKVMLDRNLTPSIFTVAIKLKTEGKTDDEIARFLLDIEIEVWKEILQIIEKDT